MKFDNHLRTDAEFCSIIAGPFLHQARDYANKGDLDQLAASIRHLQIVIHRHWKEKSVKQTETLSPAD